MDRTPIRNVDETALAQLWAENRVAEKRAGGVLRDIISNSLPARNPRYLGGESNIVKLVTAGGQHVGTIHEIVPPDGTVPHSHPKDYTLRDCSRVRLAAEL